MYDAKSFIYNGKCSDDFDVMIGYFNAPEYKTGLERETLHTDRTISRNRIKYYGSKYVNGISFTFSIAKKSVPEFTEEESIMINEWLTQNSVPTLLHFNSSKNIYVNYYAICTNIEDKVINGRNAKTLTFETDSPFVYSDLLRKKIMVSGQQNTCFLNPSCEPYYYPKIRIIPDSSVITIENERDLNSVTLDLSDYTDGILIDCENCRVLDTDGKPVMLDAIGWNGSDYTSHISANNTDTQSIYFPRLLQGENPFIITGNCTIEFMFEFPRKAGSI